MRSQGLVLSSLDREVDQGVLVHLDIYAGFTKGFAHLGILGHGKAAGVNQDNAFCLGQSLFDFINDRLLDFIMSHFVTSL